MSLETDLKQIKPFVDNQNKTFVNIVYTGNRLITITEEILKPFGIGTHQQYNILRILRGQYPNGLCLQDVKCRMLDKNSDVSRLVDRLVQNDLVSRIENPENRRKVDVRISQKGLDILSEIEPALKSLNSLFTGISESQLEELNTILDRIRDNAQPFKIDCEKSKVN